MTSLWDEPAVKNPPPRGSQDRVLAALLLVAVVLEVALRSDLV